MLPFRSFYGFESWLDHSGYSQSQGPASFIKSMELDGGKSIKPERKSTEACKSHREAERRRRQRINAHLSTLRSLLPNTAKSDKASLLAEVVQRVKDLRKQAHDVAPHHDGDLSCSTTTTAEATSDPADTELWPFPGESDEATLSYCDASGDSNSKLLKATLCCEDRPNLNRDLAQAIRSARAKAVRAEIMTVGGRTKSVVMMQMQCPGPGGKEEEVEIRALERALMAVVENRALVGSGLGRMGSKTCSLVRSTLALVGPSFHGDHTSRCSPFVPRSKFAKWAKTEAVSPFSVKEKQLEIPSQEYNYRGPNMDQTDGSNDLFGIMKQRFLSFKNQKYMEELEHFQALAEAQSPKFMVIACADSRVCPSNVLGFQPGEAFMIRNIANLVPPMKNGPTECNAALEFAVTILKVENILVIGHSSCAGIETLMNIQEDAESSFINKWVINGTVSKLKTKAATANLSFGEQCKFCEKESINQSLMNLLSYPWIQDKVRNELLFLHGGYYDFSNCSFEKWTLDFKACDVKEGGNYYRVKEQDFWC
ncbi:beta carbonic anhydrase 5, chloroplastic-like isoform X1 [Senna tora]|uniref:carbonic anhydrase n=1 Tax=Senna tora TaxID=362788 RepID=A0A834U0U3_9FABA|nr:beta carbonic anhydrase 5, chloroplastic-like isoform X1 [Senna tora]